MANAYSVTSKVLDRYLAAFHSSLSIFDIANTQPTQDFDTSGEFGYGYTVKVRRQPRYFVQETDLPATGGISLNVQDINQETEDVTIEKLFTIPINLNVVESALNMRTAEAFNKEYVFPAMLALKKKVANYFYGKFTDAGYYISNLNGGVLDSQDQIGEVNAIMDSLQMPIQRQMLVSPRDAQKLRATFGAYLNENASQAALIRGKLGMIDGLQFDRDDTIRVVTAGTASANDGLTLDVAVVNLATTITLANIVVGQTIIVGNVITTNDNDVNYVSPIDKLDVETDMIPVAFCVAADSTNSDFDTATNTYTATATTMTVKVSKTIRTDVLTDTFAYIQGDSSDEIPAGEKVSVVSDHRANIGATTGCLSVAAPAVTRIENSIFANSSYKGINMFIVKQGNATTLSNIQCVGLQIGATAHPDYFVRALSQN